MSRQESGRGIPPHIYAFAVTSAAAIIQISPTERLLEHLRRHHHEQWARLVFFPNAPGRWSSPDGMAILQFLLTRQNLGDDPILETLYREARKRSIFLVCITIHLPVLWTASIVLLS
jgi:hypothetical protein